MVDYDKRMATLAKGNKPNRKRGGAGLESSGKAIMKVFVKNMRGQALMPCSQRKARILLKQKKAKIVGYKPFTIQLCYATGEARQEVIVGIDEGAKHIGIAIVSQNKVLVKGEVELRQDVHSLLLTRAQYRRGRRFRKTRYRKARFLNRRKPEGWLPPSIRAKLDANFTWINKFCSLVPNPRLRIEVGKFDVAKMINPDIQGVDYQHGQTYGYYDVRYFVFARDEYTCQVCKKKVKSCIRIILYIAVKAVRTGQIILSQFALTVIRGRTISQEASCISG